MLESGRRIALDIEKLSGLGQKNKSGDIMGLWDKYRLNLVPEEQRAEAIKELIKEKEQTEKSKLESNGYQVIRGFIVIALLGVAIVFSLFACC